MSNPIQNSPKKPPKSVPIRIIAEARAAYIRGLSLSEIVRLLPGYTRAQIKHLKETECWEAQKLFYEKEMSECVYRALESDQVKLRHAIHQLAEQAYEKILAGLIEVNSVRDIRMLCELVELIPKTDEKSKKRRFQDHEIDNIIDKIVNPTVSSAP